MQAATSAAAKHMNNSLVNPTIAAMYQHPQLRLAGRTINGLVVRASACQAGDPVSNPSCAVFPVQPVALRLPEFSGKELEYCLCYLIEWGEILPVKKAWCLVNTRGCGPDITQHTPVDLSILCKDVHALLHVISLVDWPKHVKFFFFFLHEVVLRLDVSPDDTPQGQNGCILGCCAEKACST